MGRREEAKKWGIEWELKRIEVWNFLGSTSEKGSTRKDTGNRVTSWSFLLLGEFWAFTLIYEEN
jgi:hypothetical protein